MNPSTENFSNYQLSYNFSLLWKHTKYKSLTRLLQSFHTTHLFIIMAIKRKQKSTFAIVLHLIIRMHIHVCAYIRLSRMEKVILSRDAEEVERGKEDWHEGRRKVCEAAPPVIVSLAPMSYGSFGATRSGDGWHQHNTSLLQRQDSSSSSAKRGTLYAHSVYTHFGRTLVCIWTDEHDARPKQKERADCVYDGWFITLLLEYSCKREYKWFWVRLLLQLLAWSLLASHEKYLHLVFRYISSRIYS